MLHASLWAAVPVWDWSPGRFFAHQCCFCCVTGSKSCTLSICPCMRLHRRGNRCSRLDTCSESALCGRPSHSMHPTRCVRFGQVSPEVRVLQMDPVTRTITPTEFEGVKLVSFGWAGQGSAIMRGPMVSGAPWVDAAIIENPLAPSVVQHGRS